MGLLKSKLMLRLTLAVSVFGVAVGGVSTMAWFQINTSANNIDQGAATRNLQSTATVYQDNNHSNDDVYQSTPTSDDAGTLSYDHARGGKATNYYIRLYDNNVESNTLQMYTNTYNNDDKAVYYNITFTDNWKVYNASTGDYYGYNDIDASCPVKTSNFEAQGGEGDGRDNIHCTNTNVYYDVYFTSNNKIWVVPHSEETTSAEMGNETGYYLYGTNADSYSSLVGHADIQHGIPMYVNAARDTHDLAYYAGFRASVGDVFYLASGETTDPYKVSDSGEGNLLNLSSYFTFNTTTGAITCTRLGYYCIALKNTNPASIYINEWDGMEVDGETRYEVSSPTPLNNLSASKNNVERKARRNAATNTTARIYWKVDWESITYAWSESGGTLSKDNVYSPTYANLGYSTDGTYYVIDTTSTSANSLKLNFKQWDYWYCYPNWNGSKNNQTDSIIGDTFDAGSIYTLEISWSSESEPNKWWGWTKTHVGYFVNYDYNGGSPATGQKAHQEATGSWTAQAAPSKTGYTFAGWKRSDTGAIVSAGQSGITIPDSSISLTAQWTPKSYTITYKDQGGSAFSGTHETGYPTSHTYGTATTLKTASKTGYTFGGWFTTSGCTAGTNVTSLGATAYTANITLFAKWTINSHSLAWNFNDGTPTTSYTAAGIYNYGTPITKPTLEKSGYIFSGWSSSDTTMPDYDLTLTASWSYKTFTIAYNANGGSGSMSNQTNAKIGTTLTSNSYSYSPREFLGWGLTAGQKLPDFTNRKTLTAADADTLYANKNGSGIVTLYALWGDVYTVTINVGSVPSGVTPGTVSASSITNVPDGTAISTDGNTLTIGESTITATPKAQTDQYSYSFSSWTIEDSATTVTKNLTITANFTETLRNYTVSLSSNNNSWGTLDVTSVSNVPYGSSYEISGNNMVIKNPSGTTITTITPTPASDSLDGHYTYGYGSWSSEEGDIHGAIELTFSFTQTVKQYTVTINRNNNSWGTVSSSSVANVPWGTILSNSSNVLNVNGTKITATPTSDTAEWDYGFGSWTNGTAAVTGNLTVTANFTQVKQTYTITINRNNNSWGTTNEATISSVPYGSTITKGTGVNANKITVGSTTITATPAARGDRYNYSFGSWSVQYDATTVTGALTITANFNQNTNTYTVIWKDGDGETLETDSGVIWHTTPSYSGSTPTKTEDASYTYVFSGEWDPDATSSSIEGSETEIVFEAQFTPVPKPQGYIRIDHYDWEDMSKYALVTNPSTAGEIMITGVTLWKGWDFKIYTNDWYGYNNGKNESGSAIYNGRISEGASDRNFHVNTSGVYDIYVKTNELSTSANTNAIWISAGTPGELTITTKIKYGASEDTVSTYTNYIEGEEFNAPSLPTALKYGYDVATQWYTNSSGTGDPIDSGDTIVIEANTVLWAIYSVSETYTYYFDIWDIKDAGTLTTGLKVHAWVEGASGEGNYNATKINNDYNYYWQVDIPYASGLKMQIHNGTNTQTDGAKISASAKDGDIYKVTSWSSTTQTGYWLDVNSNGSIHVVSMYVTKDNREAGGSLVNDAEAKKTYTVLNQESWTIPAINTVYTNITGYTLPSVVNETTNTGTTRNPGYVISNVTADYNYYGVYTLILYTFRVCESTAINGNSYEPIAGKTATYNVYNDTSAKTITGIQFGQGKLWYVDSNLTGSYQGTIMYSGINTGGNINITMAGVTAGSYDISKYFYKPDGTLNARTRIGGTYSITIDVVNQQITNITLTNIDLNDFVVVGKGGAFGSQNNDFVLSEGFYATSATGNGSTIDFNYGAKHIWIFDQMKAVRPYDSGSNTHIYSNSYSGDSNGYFIIDSNRNNNIRCLVDLGATFKVSFNVSTGSFSIVLSSIAETICTRITFDHAEDAGIYLETASNNTFTTDVKRVMMHTTSGKDSGGNTYLAQEGPIYTAASGSHLYMRVVVTHSNYFNVVPDDESKYTTIKYLTEYYYVAQDNTHSGFNSSTNTANNYDYDFDPGRTDYHGNGPDAYIDITVSGTWTISLRSDGKIHVEEYSGAATVSTEHEVPYYLIGRGMPGSDLRGYDFTTARGINLWTYGGNSSTVPCYVGKYGNNLDSGTYIGTGINLKKGDQFALASVSKQLLTFASSSTANFTIDNETKKVTINTSGLYRIYITGSVGSEQININYVSAGSDWTRSGDIVSRNGVSPISSTGNTMTFGGNLDYSLLDAYGSNGYSFVVQFDHVSTGAAGTMDYSITNSNGYQIKVAKKNGNNASAEEYSANQSIAASGNYTYDSSNSGARSITASTTTSTCIRVTIPANQIRSMISSGVYSFSISISYTFREGSIAL